MVVASINQVAARAVAEAHGFDWHYRQHTESTNADALRHYDDHGREVVAYSEAQSAGRGRRGRQWQSPYARNIYCTVGICKGMPAIRQGLVSIVAGLALCRALKQSAGADVGLKWPNDLLFKGRKLGGILIESRLLDIGQFYFAIGFGINVLMDAAELEKIGQPAISLQQFSAAAVDRSQVLVAAIDAVINAVRDFEPAATDDLIAEFAQADVYAGEVVEVVSGEDRVSGINRGITDSGYLQLETEQGMELHSAAEISLRAPAA